MVKVATGWIASRPTVLSRFNIMAPLKIVFLSDCGVAALSAMLINCLC